MQASNRTLRARSGAILGAAVLAAFSPAHAADPSSQPVVVAIGPEHRAPLASRPASRTECTMSDGATARLELREIRDDTTTSSTWQDDDKIAADVVVSVTDSAGQPVGASFVVNDQPAQMYTSWSETISCMGDGTVVATWRRFLDDGGGLFARVFAPDGSSQGEEIELPESSWPPVSAVRFGASELALLYPASGGLAVVRLATDTRELSVPLVLPGLYVNGFAVSHDRNRLALVWSEGQLRVDATVIDLDTQTFSEPIQVSTHPYGGNGQLNTTPLADGRFSVTWRNEAQGGRVARTIAFADSGTTTTSTTTTTLDESAIHFDDPVLLDEEGPTRWVHDGGRQILGADAQGTWLATWRAGNRSGREFEYVDTYGLSIDNGRDWSLGPAIRATDDLWTSFDARVAGDGTGAWLQAWWAWAGTNDGNYEILGVRSADRGATWTAPYAFLAPPSRGDAYSGGPDFLEMRATSPSHWIMAVGDTYDFSESVAHPSIVKLLASDDGGATWSVSAEFPRLANIPWNGGALAAGAGFAFAVWSENDSLMITTSRDSGATWSEPSRLHDDLAVSHGSFRYETGMDAAIDGDGIAILTWRAAGLFGEDNDILVVRSTDGARTWSEPMPIGDFAVDDEAEDESPSLAVDSSGLWMVAWASHFDGGGRWGMDSDVLFSHSDDGGLTWSAPAPVADDAATDEIEDTSAKIDTSYAGVFGVLWSREKSDQQSVEVKILFASVNLRCGNGEVDTGETCDDGNAIEGDACDSDCHPPSCGNGILDPGEACDDGDVDDADECLPSCEQAACGDGKVQKGVEGCDDGNHVDTDACPSTCQTAVCGDGLVRAGAEECDDGNDNRFDACLPSCRAASCGDWLVRRGVEQCDDGNRNNDDWCSNDCTLDVDCTNVDTLQAVATDARNVLRYAVGATWVCDYATCDLNFDGNSTALDAYIVLRTSIGLRSAARCEGNALVVRLLGPVVLGALQFRIPHAYGFDRVARDSDGRLDCENLAGPNVLAAFHDGVDSLSIGFVGIEGFSGPIELAVCRMESGSVGLDQLEAIVEDATTTDGAAVPSPDLIVFGR